MQKMSKKELIEYFIEILDDNHVIGKYFSIDEIRECLNENIKNVTYEPEKGNRVGSYESVQKIINIDLNKTHSILEFKEFVVHEFLHALSFSMYEDTNLKTLKTGFEITQESKKEPFYHKDERWIYTKDRTIKIWGKSINEGITQLLTEEILGMNTSETYEEEKDVTKVLFAIIGKDNMLDHYFAKLKSNDEVNRPLKYFFGDSLQRNYQIRETKNIDHNIIFLLDKSIQFSDWLNIVRFNTNSCLDNDQKNLYDNNYKRLCHIIENLSQNALETIKETDNFQVKRQIIESMIEFHNSDISMNIDTPELANDVQKVVFDKNKSIRLGKRIWQYKQFTKNGLDFSKCGKSIEEYCVEHKIINKTDFSKSDMLRCIFKHYGEDLKFLPDMDIKKILSNFSYKIIDGNYELYYHGIDPQIAKEVNLTSFNINEYKRLSDDMEEKNVERKISRFINSLIGIDEDRIKVILNESLHNLHKELSLNDISKIISEIKQMWGNFFDEIFLNNLQKFYITKADFSKDDMLLNIFEYDNIENIQNFYYKKIGSYYELIDQQSLENPNNISVTWTNTHIYNANGKVLHPYNIFKEDYKNGQKTYYTLYSSGNNNLLEKAKQFNQSQSNKFSEIHILENNVKFCRIENKKIVSYTYILNESGELELAMSELPRRIVDDMTQLDIQLMQETKDAGITLSDMKRVSQVMMTNQTYKNREENLKEND